MTRVLSVPNFVNKKPIYRKMQHVGVLPESADEQLEIEDDGSVISAEPSAMKARELMAGIEDVRRGQGDYAMSGSNGLGVRSSIWFWWFLSSDSL